MPARSLLVAGVWLCLASAAAAYPVVVPKVSDVKQRAREAEFRQRNRHQFRTVEVGPRGFIKRVLTDDPALVPTATRSANGTMTWNDAPVRDFLRANADLFGFAAATVDRIPVGGGPSLVLVDAIGGAVLGEINVQYYNAASPPTIDITVMFWIDATPKLDEAAIARRVIGRSYTETLRYARSPGLDCGMTAMGKAGCKMPVRGTRSRTVVIAADNVSTTTWLLGTGNTIRLVTCVEARTDDPPEPDPAWGEVGVSEQLLAPRKGAPQLPLVVDAVTGKTVALRVSSCSDPIFVSVRDE